MVRFNTPEGKIPMPIISLGLMAVIVAFAYILPIAFEREERRQRIVQQHHCEQYGPTIAKWAEEKGIENPCDKTNQQKELNMIKKILDEKQGVAPYEFAEALAYSVVPAEMLNQNSERLIEQIAMAALSSAATGEETKIEITIEVKNGIPNGLLSKIVSGSYDKLKAMNEDEMVKAVLPTLIMKLKNDAARYAIKSFNLSDMLRDIMEESEDDEADNDNGDTKESQEQDAQAAS